MGTIHKFIVTLQKLKAPSTSSEYIELGKGTPSGRVGNANWFKALLISRADST